MLIEVLTITLRESVSSLAITVLIALLDILRTFSQGIRQLQFRCIGLVALPFLSFTLLLASPFAELLEDVQAVGEGMDEIGDTVCDLPFGATAGFV
jgi:hypothetical protein